MKCQVWERIEFDLIGLDEIYIFGFYSFPRLSKQPVPLENAELNPGDIVTKLGGKKTSAGFTTIKMHDGSGLEFVGSKLCFEGEIVCFNQISKGKRRRILGKDHKGHWLEKYKIAYYGFVVIEPGVWFYTSRQYAGRIVETTLIEIEERNKNDISRSATRNSG